MKGKLWREGLCETRSGLKLYHVLILREKSLREKKNATEADRERLKALFEAFSSHAAANRALVKEVATKLGGKSMANSTASQHDEREADTSSMESGKEHSDHKTNGITYTGNETIDNNNLVNSRQTYRPLFLRQPKPSEEITHEVSVAHTPCIRYPDVKVQQVEQEKRTTSNRSSSNLKKYINVLGDSPAQPPQPKQSQPDPPVTSDTPLPALSKTVAQPKKLKSSTSLHEALFRIDSGNKQPTTEPTATNNPPISNPTPNDPSTNNLLTQNGSQKLPANEPSNSSDPAEEDLEIKPECQPPIAKKGEPNNASEKSSQIGATVPASSLSTPSRPPPVERRVASYMQPTEAYMRAQQKKEEKEPSMAEILGLRVPAPRPSSPKLSTRQAPQRKAELPTQMAVISETKPITVDMTAKDVTRRSGRRTKSEKKSEREVIQRESVPVLSLPANESTMDSRSYMIFGQNPYTALNERANDIMISVRSTDLASKRRPKQAETKLSPPKVQGQKRRSKSRDLVPSTICFCCPR